MKAADLIKYANDPQLMEAAHVKELQQLVNDFPYFQSAHLLLSLASRKWDASVYQQSLKRTAIVVPNRTHLFNLIHQVHETVATPVAPVVSVAVAEKPLPAVEPETTSTPVTTAVGQELDMLKAAEVIAEEEAPVQTAETENTDAIELEIGKQVVSAFVEKEMLKTHEAHQPATSQKEEPDNFGDWLSFLKKNNGPARKPFAFKDQTKPEKQVKPEAPVSDEDQQTRRKKQQALIDQIIEKNPGHIRGREEKFYTPETRAKESLLNNEHLVTETLARIYALQGNVNKAVRAYEILSLKYPQKSAYFASLIQKLKNNT